MNTYIKPKHRFTSRFSLLSRVVVALGATFALSPYCLADNEISNQERTTTPIVFDLKECEDLDFLDTETSDEIAFQKLEACDEAENLEKMESDSSSEDGTSSTSLMEIRERLQ